MRCTQCPWWRFSLGTRHLKLERERGRCPWFCAFFAKCLISLQETVEICWPIGPTKFCFQTLNTAKPFLAELWCVPNFETSCASPMRVQIHRLPDFEFVETVQARGIKGTPRRIQLGNLSRAPRFCAGKSFWLNLEIHQKVAFVQFRFIYPNCHSWGYSWKTTWDLQKNSKNKMTCILPYFIYCYLIWMFIVLQVSLG